MDDKLLYLHVAEQACMRMTRAYSTSFYSAILLLNRRIRQPIFNIYGMVRLADEVVDSFQDQPDIVEVFRQFKAEVWRAIERRYSTNLILHGFQQTYHRYALASEHVEAFLESMEMDLYKKTYTEDELKRYIYGSAEVVGLMCLKVFCHGEQASYDFQKSYACLLGSFFQKVNFLRDVASDYQGRERIYFALYGLEELKAKKDVLVEEMYGEMQKVKDGIKQLPASSRLGVYVAFRYYGCLLKKMKARSAEELIARRVSVPRLEKIYILGCARLAYGIGCI